MQPDHSKKRIAILGGGPSGLFMYKKLIESPPQELEISIFERSKQLGAGMPYSQVGANLEHITNVSDNEIPTLVNSIEDWVAVAPKEILDRYDITSENFNTYKVLPRLFFGEYLSAQFELLQQIAKKNTVTTKLHLETTVVDVIYQTQKGEVSVLTAAGDQFVFDYVVMCTGHHWPKKHEGKIPGYFDVPYPPSKLELKLNHPVAIKGSSLTAIDAIRTLSRYNGVFTIDKHGNTHYELAKGSENFRIVVHSRNGMLPAVRFHLEDSHLGNNKLLTEEEMQKYRDDNGGFLSLDYLFENNFKAIFREKDPSFYDQIKDLKMEAFVEMMMDLRESLDPFLLLRAEYQEAEQSIRRHESIYWKEMLAILSVAMNYPAKYLSAEDMLRLQKTLMPLISIVIAFIPQGSCRELIALHQAEVISLVAVGNESKIEPLSTGGINYHYKNENGEAQVEHFKTFVDAVGQPHLSYEEFPFKGLRDQKVISKARLKFNSNDLAAKLLFEGNEQIENFNGDYYLRVPGIAINDFYQVIDEYGAFNDQIYIMAVPYIGGFNPDYSGLDFCEAASTKIARSIFSV